MLNDTPPGTSRPRELQVHIRYHNRRFFSALGCALSPREIWLDTRHLTLPTGTMIDLEFQIGGREWMVPAIVIQHNRHGVQASLCSEQPILPGAAQAESNATDDMPNEHPPVLRMRRYPIDRSLTT